MNTNKEIKIALNQIELFLKRGNLMLFTGKKGQAFPPDLEYSELELKSLETTLDHLVIKLLNTSSIPENIWISPVRYAYKGIGSSKTRRWTWLEQFVEGLKVSREFLKSYLYMDSETKSINIQFENSTGVAIAIGNSQSIVEIENSLNSEDMASLAEELSQLREKLKEESKTAEQDIEVSKIAQAEISAKNGDKSETIKHLKSVGKWVFDTATKIGISITSKLLTELIK